MRKSETCSDLLAVRERMMVDRIWGSYQPKRPWLAFPCQVRVTVIPGSSFANDTGLPQFCSSISQARVAFQRAIGIALVIRCRDAELP